MRIAKKDFEDEKAKMYGPLDRYKEEKMELFKDVGDLKQAGIFCYF